MPVSDVSAIIGSFNQSISDWALGDDRQFSGDVQSSPNPPPIGDLSLSDAFFTLKFNPLDVDANALIQKHITQSPSSSGQITAGLGGFLSSLLIKIFSGDYEGINSIVAGPVYYWDVRCITAAGGVTFTVATGSIRFIQNVTQANKAGVPAVFPNDGQPRFRGFLSANPMGIPGLVGPFNAGDIYFNSNPSNGNGAGWQCWVGGGPGTWAPLGLTPPVFLTDVHFKGYAAAPPLVGTFVQGDYILSTNPLPATPGGWVCTVGGTPGTWNSIRPIGDTTGLP